jgi:hypothetical protein
VSDRWQDDPARAPAVAWLLGEVARKRGELDAARAAAADASAPAHERAELRRRALGAEVGLRAAIGMAALDRSAPPDDEIAAAADWPVEGVAHQRNVLNAITAA